MKIIDLLPESYLPKIWDNVYVGPGTCGTRLNKDLECCLYIVLDFVIVFSNKDLSSNTGTSLPLKTPAMGEIIVK